MSNENEVDDDPKCDKCGAPITTGAMAAFCPLVEQCEFWVPEQSEFLHELREGFQRDNPLPGPGARRAG